MLNCEKCGKEITQEEVYEVNNKKLCEACAISGTDLNSPSKPCGVERL